MENSIIHVTDFYTSRFTEALCITVGDPIRDNSYDIIGNLSLDIRFEDLANMEAEEFKTADNEDSEE